MSATLLIERWPSTSSRFLSHSGDGAIFTPRTTRAAYRGHKSGSRISTDAKSDVMKRTKYKAQRTKDRSLSELFEKSHIILEQQTDIIELINSCAGAIDAEAKRKAGEYFRIYIGSAQDIWMHHARAA